MSNQLDTYILDIASLAKDLVSLGKNLLEISAVGMYVYFLENSIEGVDCGYVKKSRARFWTEQHEGIYSRLNEIHQKIGKVLSDYESARQRASGKD